MKDKRKIEVTEDGPYLISGDVPLAEEQVVVDRDGASLKWKVCENYKIEGKYKLCRCGHSQDKPFCDSSHLEADFDGTETAKDVPFDEQADVFDGPELILKDLLKLCTGAGFCHRAGGIWDLVENPQDDKAKKVAIEEACNCPSGRLVVIDKKNRQTIEPELDQSISATKDNENIAGPLWVKGGIPIGSVNGKTYEIRNRVTLCRCGRSRNKPFCDGFHNQI
jgi:CDGSH-type Zn-finger protein